MVDKKSNLKIIENGEINIFSLIKILYNNKRMISFITFIITIIGITYSILVTPLFKSTITMYPISETGSMSKISTMQGIASNFGFDLGGSQHEMYIPDIINSRSLRTKIINNKWKSNKFKQPINLISYWGINNKKYSLNPIIWIKSIINNNIYSNPYLKWEEKALFILNQRLVITESQSGLITVEVLMEEPKLAAELANYIYSAITDFTIQAHTNTAQLNREFIEKRQLEINKKLIDAEDKLKEFRQNNRRVFESPLLQLEQERLLREVEIQTQTYITLKQQYELARIDEIKKTPSVIIVDAGIPASKKSSPKRKLIVIISILLGFTISSIIIIIKRNFKN